MILIKNYIKIKGGSNKEDYSLLKIIAKNKSKSPISTINQIQKIKEQLEKKKAKEDLEKYNKDLNKLDKKIKNLGL